MMQNLSTVSTESTHQLLTKSSETLTIVSLRKFKDGISSLLHYISQVFLLLWPVCV